MKLSVKKIIARPDDIADASLPSPPGFPSGRMNE
jgi:hypothetical protein